MCIRDSSKALPISLQHIMAMFLGTVTVPIVIAGAAGADAATRTIMIQYSLMMSALATMIQVCPLGPVGSRLPVIFCAGFTCVPVFTPIAAQYGLPGVFGACLLYTSQKHFYMILLCANVIVSHLIFSVNR